MKRLAMELLDSPVNELPSYLEMAKNKRHASNQNPRWWMACNYDALTRNEDKTAWKLSGQGVKTMTEQDLVVDDGSTKQTGRTDKVAQAWADKMTDTYGDLSNKMPIFADLRNLMDLTVVATLIAQESLAERAEIDLSVLRDSDDVELVKYTAPKALAPQCSFVKGRSGWIVTASGGVDINGFEVVQNQKVDQSVTDVRKAALKTNGGDTWWWNK